MALTATLIGRGTTGGNSVTTASGTSASSATFACLVSYDATAGSIATATDNKGNTYTAVGTAQADGAGGLLRWYVCEAGVGGSSHTFTFTTASNNFGVAHLVQITSDASGIPRLDINVQGTASSQPWAAVATGTLNYADEVILGAVGCNSNGGSTAAYTSGNMTMLSSEGDCGSFWTSGVAGLNQAGTSSFTPSFSKVDAGGATGAGLSHITFREETSGNGNAAGVTVTAAASLVAGSAVGDGNASATGATVTAAASLVVGQADGGEPSLLFFRAFPRVRGGDAEWFDGSPASALLLTDTFGPQVESGDATAAGVTLTAAASLIAGSATGIRNGTAAGVTLTAAASLIAGTAGNAPELGAYTYVGQEEANGTDPATTPSITTTASGSSFLALRAGYASNNSRPTDSKSNRWRHMGGAVYNGWAGVFDAQVYIAQNGTGGSGHTVTFEKDAQPAGEITIPLIEAKAGTRLVDYSLVNITAGNALTSGSVTVSGPALLVAVWLGDGGGLTHAATPNNSFTNFISFGSLPPNSAVQMFCASRQVSGAGTYDVTWAESPDQGAILVLAAFGENGPNGYAPEDTLTAAASLIPGSASGSASGTANGVTVSAAASLVAGTATGGASAAGATVVGAASLVAGTATGGAVASGQTLTAAASLLAGSASGAASGTAAGVTLTAAASLTAGTATGGGTATGALLAVQALLQAGSAAGSALAAGQTFTATAALLAGAASGGGPGAATAPGVTLQAVAALIAGVAYSPELLPDSTARIGAAVAPGAAGRIGTTSASPSSRIGVATARPPGQRIG